MLILTSAKSNINISLYQGTFEFANVFIGNDAGSGAINGADKCVGIGVAALQGALTIDGTIAIGWAAGNAITSGERNLTIGYQAGKAMTDADDNVLIQGIGGDKGSLGYFGYAYYQESKDKLKLLGIDSGSGCVKPSPISIPSGKYTPLSRPLFIYVNTDSYKNKPAVKRLVDFYMIHGPELINEVGYIASNNSVNGAIVNVPISIWSTK